MSGISESHIRKALNYVFSCCPMMLPKLQLSFSDVYSRLENVIKAKLALRALLTLSDFHFYVFFTIILSLDCFSEAI